jgi:hypothetical protein
MAGKGYMFVKGNDRPQDHPAPRSAEDVARRKRKFCLALTEVEGNQAAYQQLPAAGG